MRRTFIHSVAFASVTALSLSGFSAVAENATPAKKVELPNKTLQMLTRNPDQFLQRMVTHLYRIAPDGVATVENQRAFEHVEKARMRAGMLGKALSADLNGDGNITPEEFAEHDRYSQGAQRAQNIIRRVQSDKNGDKTLTFSELVAQINVELEKTSYNRFGRRGAVDPMTFDLDGDKSVDVDELTRAVMAIAKDKTLVTPTASTHRNGRQLAVCTPPKPPKGAEVILLGGYEGAAISSVATGGLNSETSAAVLHIEKGDTPLYILAGAYDNIVWLVEGHVERVVNFVAQPGRRANPEGHGVGVVGLDKSVVSFVEAQSCFNYFKSPSDGKARLAEARVTAALDQKIDRLIGAYGLNEISIPSGKGSEKKRRGGPRTVIVTNNRRFVLTEDGPKLFEDTSSKAAGRPDGVDSRTWDLFLRYYPSGTIQISAEDVISPGPVVTYDVLPQQAGLIQLIKAGAIMTTSDGFYRIVKPITRFPAGLNGGHSVKFLLSKDVPMPAGSAGHSSVWSEETGECLSGAICR